VRRAYGDAASDGRTGVARRRGGNLRPMHSDLRRAVAVVLLTCLLSGCTTAPDAALRAPDFDIVEYFVGQTYGAGVMERSGRVAERFEMLAEGAFDGETLTLDETFTFADGTTFRRAWRMRSPTPGLWIAEADNVIGEVEIRVKNGVARMRYLADFPRGDSMIRLRFTQMLTPMGEDVLLNRSQLTKFGFLVGVVTVLFGKPPRR
jgi:hypothetical protein